MKISVPIETLCCNKLLSIGVEYEPYEEEFYYDPETVRHSKVSELPEGVALILVLDTNTDTVHVHKVLESDISRQGMSAICACCYRPVEEGKNTMLSFWCGFCKGRFAISYKYLSYLHIFCPYCSKLIYLEEIISRQKLEKIESERRSQTTHAKIISKAGYPRVSEPA